MGGKNLVGVSRQKLVGDFKFTKIPFPFDAEDYHYIPGLTREHDAGFLTPVFLNREASIKYDVHPSYRVRFASRTYGEIWQNDFSILFGISRNGKLVMWLGDIGRLLENEQYYLRSENIPSDHSIGSEFYNGQIECVFTERTPEVKPFASRSNFIEVFHSYFGIRPANLEKEVLDLAITLQWPVVDTPTARRNVAEEMNKVYVESFDNAALDMLVSANSLKPKGTGNLKRLQALLEAANSSADVHNAMSPLFLLYDLHVAHSHLASDAGQEARLMSVRQRPGLTGDAGLFAIYDAIVPALENGFKVLGSALYAT